MTDTDLINLVTSYGTASCVDVLTVPETTVVVLKLQDLVRLIQLVQAGTIT